jgi:hypothetical protein
MVYEVGVHKIPFDEYLSDPAPEPSLSRSTIRDLLFQCPAIAWFNHPRLNPNYKKEEDVKFNLGTAAHALLLEGIDTIAVIEADDWRTKAAKEEREKACKEARTPLLRAQYDTAKVMVDVALQSIYGCKELKITDLKTDGNAETTYIWAEKDPSGFNIWLRIRPDWLSNDRIICLDYKTTQLSVNPNNLSRQIFSLGYPLQAALYCRGIEAIDQVKSKFIMIFQEINPPYLCSFVGLSPAFMELGVSQLTYGIFLWGGCLSSNKWSAYSNRIAWIDLPPWASASWEEIASQIGAE